MTIRELPEGVDPDVLKRIAEMTDGDTWVLADFLAEVFPEDEYPIGDANNGLHDILAKYERTALVEHGVEVKATTMRLYRSTAIAWPRDARASRASFKVHARMKGPDRFAEMANRLKQAEREERALSASMLKRLREDDGPPRHVDTMQEKIRKRVLAAVKGVLLEGIHPEDKRREDWWNLKRVTDPQLDMAVSELRRLADIIQTRGGGVTMKRAQFLELYCGNFECPTRTEEMPDGSIGRTFTIDASSVPDGELWLCEECQTD